MSDASELTASMPRAASRGSDFAELCRLIKREGLLDRRPR